jgi:hypothetical protein
MRGRTTPVLVIATLATFALALAVAVAIAIGGCGGTTTVVDTVTTEVPSPSQRLVLAHRSNEGPRITPGPHIEGASGCTSEGASG